MVVKVLSVAGKDPDLTNLFAKLCGSDWTILIANPTSLQHVIQLLSI